jgi:hypothetical protein
MAPDNSMFSVGIPPSLIRRSTCKNGSNTPRVNDSASERHTGRLGSDPSREVDTSPARPMGDHRVGDHMIGRVSATLGVLGDFTRAKVHNDHGFVVPQSPFD